MAGKQAILKLLPTSFHPTGMICTMLTNTRPLYGSHAISTEIFGGFFVTKNLIIFQVQVLFCVGKTSNHSIIIISLAFLTDRKKLLNKSLI